MQRIHGSDQATQVSLSQVAELAGVGPSAVSNWRRRFDDFPEPVGASADGKDLFELSTVQRWLDDHGRSIPEQRNEQRFFEAADLLRSEGPSDRITELLCAAVSLVHVASTLDAPAGNGPGVARSLSALIESVEARDPELVGLFSPLADLSSERTSRLLEVVRLLDSKGLREMFEWALGRRGRFVETRSHDSLASLLASFIEPGPVRVFDPAVGEGGFLLAASRRASLDSTFFGQEVNRIIWRITRQRLLVNGVSATIALGDSLIEDAFPDLQADVVFCDPPYGAVPRWQDDVLADGRWLFGIPPSKTADYAWIQHVIHHLAQAGRGYVLLPAGTLFRRGREADIRRELVRRGAVEAIVSLAAGTAQHTAVPLAIWILRRPTAEPAPVLFIDAGVAGSSKGGGLDMQLSAEITDAVREWRAAGKVGDRDGRLARPVSIVELLAADVNLLPSKWVHGASPVDSNLRRQEFAEAVARLERARAALAEATPDIERLNAGAPSPTSWTPIRHLLAAGYAEVIRGVRVRPEECRAGGVRALRTQDVRAGIGQATDPCFVDPDAMRAQPVLTQPGDIIVSPGGGKPVAIVDATGGYVLVFPLQALRIKGEQIDRQVVAAFLESPRNRRFVAGTTYGYARLDLGELEVPMLPREEAERLSRTLQRIGAYEELAKELADNARIAREALLDLAGTDDDVSSEQPSSAGRSRPRVGRSTGGDIRPADPRSTSR